MKRKIRLLAFNVRSLWNVGSFFRTCDACAVERIYLCGYTGTPPRKEITKTAIGAEDFVKWEQHVDPLPVLEKLKKPVKSAIFVGTPIGVRPILNYDRDSSFSGFSFDWETIKKNARSFIVFQSDDDPYVGLDNGTELAKKFGVEVSFIPNAGHFNKKAGYTKFEKLLEKVEQLLN